MADPQPRDASPGHSSDDEPQSNLTKSKGSPAADSDRHQETDTKEHSDSEDDESLLALMKKRKNQKLDPEKTAVLEKKKLSDSEDDQPLLTLMKKRKNKKLDTEETAVLDSNKTKSPRKHKTEAKASNLRQLSPSQEKTTKKRGRKGKGETGRTHSTPEKTTPKKRGRPKKKDTESKMASCDSSDNEPLVQLVKKKGQPEMKKAVVLLKRLSKKEVLDIITQGHTRTCEQSDTARAEIKSDAESSDEEPLSHKVKRLKQHSKPARGKATAEEKSEAESSDEESLSHKVKRLKQHSKPGRGRAKADVCSVLGKNKCRKRTNGEKDTPKKASKLDDELKNDSDDECLVKQKSDQSVHRETSSS